MAPRRPIERKSSLARRSQIRHSGYGRGAIGASTLNPRSSASNKETNEDRIENISEANSSTTTIASTIKALSLKSTRSKESTVVSFGSSSVSGATIEGSSGPTREEKAARKKAVKAARKENKNADPNFAYLPKGLNNKIRNKDPLKAKIRRLFKPKKKNVHKPIDRSQPVATPKLRYRTDQSTPAPERYIPPIAPARKLDGTIELDKTGAYLGGEFQVLAVTQEERDKHVEQAQFQHELRKATEQRLRLEGREQVNDPKIGRAPPIARRAFIEPTLSRQTRRDRPELMPIGVNEPPTLTEKVPPGFLPAERAQPYIQKNDLGEFTQNPHQLNDSAQTSLENLTGQTTPCSSTEILPYKPRHRSNLSSSKKPHRKQSVTFNESVTQFTIPENDYDTSEVTEIASDETIRNIALTGTVADHSRSSEAQVDPTKSWSSAGNNSRVKSKRSGISKTLDDTSKALSEDSVKKESLSVRNSRVNNFLKHASSTPEFRPASYDTITNFLLASNTPAPPIPTKSPLRNLSQPNLLPAINTLNASNSHNFIAHNQSLLAQYRIELKQLTEAHGEKMEFLKKKKQEHRKKYGDLKNQDDPGESTAKPQSKLRSRISNLFKSLEKSAGATEEEGILDNVVTSFEDPGEDWVYDPLGLIAGQYIAPLDYHRCGYNTPGVNHTLREEQEDHTDTGALSFTPDQVTPQEEHNPNLVTSTSGGYTSDSRSESEDTPKDDVEKSTSKPYYEALTPLQKIDYDYSYTEPTPEFLATESDKTAEKRRQREIEASVRANEAVLLAHEAVLRDFDNSPLAAGFHSTRKPSSGSSTTDDATNSANTSSHVTTNAPPVTQEERGSNLPKPQKKEFTASEGAKKPKFQERPNYLLSRGYSTESSTQEPENLLPTARTLQQPPTSTTPSLGNNNFGGACKLRESRGSFGFKSQNSSIRSLQISRTTETQKSSETARRSSKQFTTPQQAETVTNRHSRRVSSASSVSRQYFREESEKWINCDTLAENAAEDSDLEDSYRAYFRSSKSKKLSQDHTLTDDAQVAANLERAQARREERREARKALQESLARPAYPAQSEEDQKREAEKEAEKQAKFERPLTLRRPDHNPVGTARLRYLLLSGRDRNSLEEQEFVTLCATRYPDGSLRHEPRSEEVQAVKSELSIPRPSLNRRLDYNSDIATSNLSTFGTVRQLQAPSSINPVKKSHSLVAPDSVEHDKLRVDRLQSDRNISTGSPVSRGASTFGFNSSINAPQQDWTAQATQAAYRSQIPQLRSFQRELQTPSPSAQSYRAQSPLSVFRPRGTGRETIHPPPKNRLQTRVLDRFPPLPVKQLLHHVICQRHQSSQVSADRQGNSSASRLPVPGTNVAPGSPNIPHSQLSFLDVSLVALGAHFAEMDKLQVRNSEPVSVKTKAIEDARLMQASVIEAATKSGKEPPKYALIELIGKGSFGRVYKGKDMVSAAIVAVKIIDIEESDTINPKNANSYAEFLKEITALKTLSENKARNINHVIEALPVGQAMWMITEYCGGGSVATLMKPTAPGGLQEKWIIPILREVAEAIKWVHEAGIIHRDIKCANVLITEEGAVQLCDFGVAGTMETKVDKRSTVIGTPHWMAPELFDAVPSYGKEVDIWAFGCMAYEISTGLPPNAMSRLPFDRLGSLIKQHAPRLEGGDYSDELRDLVAFCLEEFPSERPSIDRVQNHHYILNTSSKYPMSSLSHLVRAFKLWEDHGGSRKSLFMLGGAQAPSEFSSTALSDDEWNFSTTAAFEQDVRRKSTAQDVYDVYGSGVEFDAGFPQETAQRTTPSPPEALAPSRGPLEKIFDPNTLTSYEDNVRNHYGRPYLPPTSDLPPVPSRSDLPLRDDTAQTSIRDTMIDLGGHDAETGISVFPDMDTIKAGRRVREEPDEDYMTTLPDFSRPALSDPADINPNRRTREWKFPAMVPPASADPEVSRFPPSTYEVPKPAFTPGIGSRPGLIHHPTEPLGGFSGGLPPAEIHSGMPRLSFRESLIDLDMSMPDPVPAFNPDFGRPSTADSDAISIISDSGQALSSSTVNPFELERHASLYQPTSHSREPSLYTPSHSREPSLFVPSHEREPSIYAVTHEREPSLYAPSHEREPSIYATSHEREPSIYVTEEMGAFPTSATPPRPESTSRSLRADRPPRLRTGNALRDIADISDFSDSAAESTMGYNTDTNDTDSDYATASTQPPPMSALSRDPNAPYTMAHFPNLPNAPSVRALTGEAAHEEMAFEMSRMLRGLTGQLEAFRDVYGSEDLARRSNQRRERRDNGENGV
ncbi:putative serine threonine-protein kinase nak1 protein [Botrytis fragariae]|uniref:non-specific serine/threonine protein kinase n=1 Tax=Botrytis fragariae TaxID=1964551 RepID=A0A8H6AXI6_9HELO|nr:putative serine threonine-protein kinase nak1 protein [Botrytis fragariae]KAF5875443.1 putative serine threonine-protein kinase nak1 protein [Botrytis fragariae]